MYTKQQLEILRLALAFERDLSQCRRKLSHRASGGGQNS